MAALLGSVDSILVDQTKVSGLVRQCEKFVRGILETFSPGMKCD
jgi:hypothetical protein